MNLRLTFLATVALAMTLGLSACGGGGGGGYQESTPPPQAPPPDPQPAPDPQPDPDPDPDPAPGPDPAPDPEDPPLPPGPYAGPPDNLLIVTNVHLAHEAGYDGAGVKIGMMDEPWYTDYAPLDGQVEWYHDPAMDGMDPAGQAARMEEYRAQDKTHGMPVATVLVGKPQSGFTGGVAPHARLYWTNVINVPDDLALTDPDATNADLVSMASQGVKILNLSAGAISTGLASAQRDFSHPYFYQESWFSDEQIDAPVTEYSWTVNDNGDVYSQVTTSVTTPLGPDTVWSDASPTKTYTYEGSREVYETIYTLSDRLLVAASGNNGQQDPGGAGTLPVNYPILKNNVIAVVAANITADGTPDGLRTYSNACGKAAYFCIAAPAPVVVPADPDAGVSSGSWEGTSVASPIVAGVAALVQQAYPWMGAKELQTTVLSTATDLGDPGVDSTYGWGFVNAQKAVRGPAVFTTQLLDDGFVADVPGGAVSIFSNDISGDSGLQKHGAGTLILTGNATYTGSTIVETGRLAIASGVAGGVDVNSGGILLAEGASIGEKLTLSEGSTLEAVAGGVGVTVGGAFTAAGELSFVAMADGFVPVGGVEYPVVTAQSASGTFAETTFDSGLLLTGTVHYSATGVTVDLSPVSAGLVGGLRAQAAGIDAATRAATASPGSDLADVVGAIQNSRDISEVRSLSSQLIGLDWIKLQRNQVWYAALHDDPTLRIKSGNGWSTSFTGDVENPGLAFSRRGGLWFNRLATGYLSPRQYQGTWNDLGTNHGWWTRVETAFQPRWTHRNAWAEVSVGAAWQVGFDGRLLGNFSGENYSAHFRGLDGLAPFTRASLGIAGRSWGAALYYSGERRSGESAQQVGVISRWRW